MQRPGCVLLDRDGVINADSPDYIRRPEEWHPLPGSLQALALLRRAGIPVAVVSNQSGVGRGLLSLADLQRIHRRMLAAVDAAGGAIVSIHYCPHLPGQGCGCRKPSPGLLLCALRVLRMGAGQALMIGDRESDMQAARRAGVAGLRVGEGGDAPNLFAAVRDLLT